MLTLTEERKAMALDHFSRAAVIDAAIRQLKHRYTYEMTGVPRVTQEQQLMMGSTISDSLLVNVRDKLIEAGIQLWKDAHVETLGSCTVREGSFEGQAQTASNEGSEDGKGVAYAAGVREHLADLKLSDESYKAQYLATPQP